jgi:hypothetical protein
MIIALHQLVAICVFISILFAFDTDSVQQLPYLLRGVIHFVVSYVPALAFLKFIPVICYNKKCKKLSLYSNSIFPQRGEHFYNCKACGKTFMQYNAKVTEIDNT